MVEEIKANGVTFCGFEKDDNGKIIVEDKEDYNDYTYVMEQRNAFERAIIGYVIKADEGRYKSKWCDCTFTRGGDIVGDVINYFDDKKESVDFVIKSRSSFPADAEVVWKNFDRKGEPV